MTAAKQLTGLSGIAASFESPLKILDARCDTCGHAYQLIPCSAECAGHPRSSIKETEWACLMCRDGWILLATCPA